MNRFVTVAPLAGGASRWIGPALFSVAIHAAIGAGYYVWRHAVTPPRAPTQFVVELVAVQDFSGAVETQHTTPVTAVARTRSAPPPSRAEPEKPAPAKKEPEEPEEPEELASPVIADDADPKRAIRATATEDARPPKVKTIEIQPKPTISPVLVTKPKTIAKHPIARLAGFAPALKRKPDRTTRPAGTPLKKRSPARTVKKDVTETLGQKNPPQAERNAAREIANLTQPDSHDDASPASAGEAAAKLILPRYAAPGRGNPLPMYPRSARRRSLEGRLVLRVAIDAKGQVDNVEIAKSSGHAILDRAAETAVRRWTFEPGRRAGIPVRAALDIPVVFRLRQ